jgi:hypothetical protein
MSLGALVFFAAGCVAVSASSPHPACAADITSYQAPYVAKTYDHRKVLGVRYYEVAFRDLYPASPLCDCQSSVRTLNATSPTVVMSEMFTLACGSKYTGYKTYSNPMRETTLGVGVFNQTVVQSSLPGLSTEHFTNAVIAFKESSAEGATPGSSQQPYEWNVEFQCGTDTLKHLFSGGFVGMNMYSRTRDDASRDEMVKAVTDLGLGWAMDKWGIGFHDANENTTNCTYPPLE